MTNERLEEVSSHSLDITEQNIEKLKELFPEVLTEKKIDFDKLRLILGDEVETAPERYNFTWNGKKQVMQLAQQPTVATLKPNKAKSKNWDETQNLYIEGNNLEVLKILQKSYANKVKLIYLDPPYNTGKDFIYRDNFHDSIENYLEQTGQVDNEGNKLSVNTETSGRYHTDWLNMMYPRLKLARNLLSDDGVIFVSIGTVEQENLSRLFDEIFVENNRDGIVPVIMNLKGNQDAYGFADTHEYVLVYAKSKDNLYFGRLPIDDEEMNDWLEDEYGLYKVADNLRATGVNAPRSKRPNLWYPIFVTSNDELYVTEDNEPLSNDDEIVMPINPEGEELSWYWGKATLLGPIQDNLEPGSTEDDLVYEIMLKQGLELTLPIEKFVVGDANIYKIAFGSLFIVLGENITSDAAKKIVEFIKDEELENVVVVLQDTGFANDSEKFNSIEILNAGGIDYNDILSI